MAKTNWSLKIKQRNKYNVNPAISAEVLTSVDENIVLIMSFTIRLVNMSTNQAF